MSEVLNLTKGARLDLTKTAPGVTKFAFGLGWDPQKFDGKKFDLDACAFLLKDGKAAGMADLVFYGKLASTCGSVTHSGDNLTGDGDGDDEVITVDVSKIDTTKYNEIQFAVTIYEAASRNQTFGQVDNAFIRVFDANSPVTPAICKYDLTEDFCTQTAVVIGKLYYKEDTWRFQAVGGGYDGGLAALCTGVGIVANGG